MLGDMGSVLETRAQSHPERPLYSFYDGSGNARESYTYGAFLGRVNLVGGALRDAGLGRGEPVLLVYPPGLEMVVAFFAATFIGAIPVPAPPPQSWQTASWLRLLHIARNARATRVLSTADFVGQVAAAADNGGLTGLQPLEWIATDDFRGFRDALPRSACETLFIQYTSGSTSAPRGVVVSHANAIHNGLLCLGAERQIGVSWLPHYHDMGLLGYYLYCVVNGGTSHLFAPFDFLRRPVLWFEIVSRVRATMTTAPNGGYDYCLREDKVRDDHLAGIDLSSLRSMVNCAEPVRLATYEKFWRRFSGYGLQRGALVAGFGLAEHTLCVTTGGSRVAERPGRPRETASVRHSYVSCGAPAADVDLRIVEPRTRRRMPDGEVGEIWVDSPSKARGYWHMPAESRAQFEASIAGDAGGRTYLRTGDLGFLDKGELFVCGRLRDMLIVNGRNLFPTDVEAAIEEHHPRQLGGRVAAFGADIAGSEQLIILLEIGADAVDLGALRLLVQQKCGMTADVIARVPRGTIVRTSSGKIARRICREKWEDGSVKPLEVLRGGDGSGGAIDAMIESFAAQALAIGDPDATLDRLGLDSIALVNLSLALENLLEDAGLATPERTEQVADMSLILSMRVSDLRTALEMFRGGADGAAAVVGLFERLSDQMKADERDQMRADASLPLPERFPARPSGRDILLTGTTGFLGSFLLKSLLAASDDRIWVLVRDADLDAASKRVRQALAEADCPHDLLDEALRSRVSIVLGDLSKPRLGLEPSVWDTLAATVGRIYHCGAEVDYVKSYGLLRDTNVGATRAIISLAAEGCAKTLHYISTTFIFGWSTKLRLLENDSNAEMQKLDFGYPQSKWVAEQLVLRAQAAGLATFVYRPALITASAQGRFVRRDITARGLGYMIRHGVTVDTDNQISFLPVDVCADNIVALSADPARLPPVVHMTADRHYTVADICSIISRRFGYSFDTMSLPAFAAHAHAHCTPDDDLYPLLSFFDRNTQRVVAMGSKRYDASGYRRARDTTPSARQHPSMDVTVDAVVVYLQNQGLVPVRPSLVATPEIDAVSAVR